MFNNSFNHKARFNSKCLNDYSISDKSSNIGEPTFNKNTVPNELDSQLDYSDWENKYDISLVVQREEYLQSIQRLKNVDEKANKYLIVISIVFLGLFTFISGSAVNTYTFSLGNLNLSNLLSTISLTMFSIGLYYGINLFKSVFNCLDLFEIRRMPNIEITLTDTGMLNAVEYKYHLIKCYQEAIEVICETVTAKQKYIVDVSINIKKAILYFFLSFAIIFILKLLG